MHVDHDPQRRQFVKRLLSDREGTKRELEAAQREHWRQRVLAARERVQELEARLTGMEGVFTSDPLQRVERGKLALELTETRRHLAAATERWAACGDGGEA